MATQIGTVEILKPRVYPLDADAQKDGQQVWVEPGIYPVYRDFDAIFWLMTGVLCYGQGAFRKIGDGMFVVNRDPGDERSDVEVKFPSRRYGVSDFKHFLIHDPLVQRGQQQRLRFTVGGISIG